MPLKFIRDFWFWKLRITIIYVNWTSTRFDKKTIYSYITLFVQNTNVKSYSQFVGMVEYYTYRKIQPFLAQYNNIHTYMMIFNQYNHIHPFFFAAFFICLKVIVTVKILSVDTHLILLLECYLFLILKKVIIK